MRNEITRMRLRIQRQEYLVRQQTLKLHKQAKKIHDQDTLLAEVRKHLEEWEQKMVDLTTEVSRAREGTQNPDSLEKSQTENTYYQHRC